MSKPVTLTIDGQTVTVPEGALIVDAAKKIGIDIPVFCYHPKMEPVGMCRMCLVEIGRPLIDRATGQPLREADGALKIQYGPKLETACTTPVAEGMVVIGMNEKVQAARKEIVEFILTSHPLDCPICDKGGECPLQNLTMAHGPGQSRYLYDEKMHLAKHVPLGELIYLDRERCIQCGRCVRFQDEIAGEPVIGFYHRGRALEIATFSDPGFDSVFSGNTTDICPVGALTTADFRFGARPWELKATASICSHCPVGCNITYNVRREAASGGQVVIKRAMPRQNEAVNELWLCDKGRFAYHYTESQGDQSVIPMRLTTPLIRKNGELTPASWDAALNLVADKFRAAGEKLLTLGGGRLSNEDLFNLHQLTEGLKGQAALYTQMAGGDLIAQVGVAPGTNLAHIGKGDAILVAACDLHAEAPIWWLRVKQAAERGASLIVANARPTKLERYASQVVRYEYGEEASAIGGLKGMLQDAKNAIIFYGSDGLGLSGSQAVAQACASLLIETRHVGRPNNGLVAVWQKANEQGAWDMGLRPLVDLPAALQAAQAVYIVAADPFGDDPTLLSAFQPSTFLVVQELFLTETARRADVVLPAQAYTGREGTYTSGERRVQRFYPAVPPHPGCRSDFAISAQIGARLGLSLEGRTPGAVFARLAVAIPAYAGLTYRQLAEMTDQWPSVGRGDLYYGGTAYENKQGLGVQLPLSPNPLSPVSLSSSNPQEIIVRGKGIRDEDGIWAVPITRLYDRGATVWPSALLRQRIGEPYVALNPIDAGRLGLVDHSQVTLTLNGTELTAVAKIDATAPQGVSLVPRSMGIPIWAPTLVKVSKT
jgi:NADH-quinone oxidoreductase subunit G